MKLFDIVYKAVYANYRVHLDQVLSELGYIPEGEKCSNKHAANVFFGNYMEPDADPKIYDQVWTIWIPCDESYSFIIKIINFPRV